MHSSLRIGIMIFMVMVCSCMIGTLLFPIDAHKSESELKDLAPSSSYLSVPSSLTKDAVIDLQSGISYSAALLANHQLVLWGDPPFTFEEQTEIVKMAAGYHYLLIMDRDGHIYRYDKDGRKEIKLEGDKKVKELYAGNDISACLYEDGEVELIESVTSSIYIPEELQGHIQAIDMANYHIVVLLEDGSVHIIGNQGSELAEVPEFLQDGSVKIQQVAISNEAGIALDEEGNVYTWGKAQGNMLAHTKIKQVSASSHTIFALDTTGRLISVGSDDYHERSYDENKRYTMVYADTYQIYGLEEHTIHAWGNQGFLLGSDAMGRDVLTRLLHGGRITMLIGLIVCFVEALLGLLIGMLAGYYGKWIDHILMRLCEIVSSIPFLPLVITISAFMKDSFDEMTRIILIMIVLGVLSAPSLARMIRSLIIVEREKEYVVSARVIGANTRWILRHELFPQVLHLLLVNLTLSYADTMLIESSLSFLGFGVAPPYPTWGNMLEGAQTTYVLKYCWWQWLLPALCILLCVISVNMIGEGLRKRLYPQEEDI